MNMVRIVFVSVLLIMAHIGHAQIEMPCYGCYLYHYEMEQIKFDSTGTYIYSSDSSYTVFISSNANIYKLFDKHKKLLVEGDLGGRVSIDYYKRYGKWIEYYPNGNRKAEGYYYANDPVGLWQYFYPNGHLKELYNIAYVEGGEVSGYCRVGTYQSFYENGQIKISGIYKSALDTGIIVQEDPITGETNEVKTIQPMGKPFGIWTYYKSNGEIVKKEEFRP